MLYAQFIKELKNYPPLAKVAIRYQDNRYFLVISQQINAGSTEYLALNIPRESKN